MILIQSQYLSNLRIKVLYIISISLLSKSTEIVQKLPDLGLCYLHLYTQVIG